MTARDHGAVRLDAKRRVSVGSYTELVTGDYFRVERASNGVLTLTPAFSGRGRPTEAEKDCE